MVAESTQQSYVPRSILITGGAGFIASHVAVDLALKHPEYEVREAPLRFRNAAVRHRIVFSPFSKFFNVLYATIRWEGGRSDATDAA